MLRSPCNYSKQAGKISFGLIILNFISLHGTHARRKVKIEDSNDDEKHFWKWQQFSVPTIPACGCAACAQYGEPIKFIIEYTLLPQKTTRHNHNDYDYDYGMSFSHTIPSRVICCCPLLVFNMMTHWSNFIRIYHH